MKFLSVELENYGPFYGKHTLSFKDLHGLVLFMGCNLDDPRSVSNGSGKSHLFDAVDWCNYGENPRGDHADALINEEAFLERGTTCRVINRLEDDQGRAVVITRWRSKSKRGLELTVGDQSLTKLDPSETQKEIERVLGVDRETFHAAVLFAQTDVFHYADAGDSDRMALLTRILQLEELDEWLVAAQDRRAAYLREAEATSQKLLESQTRLTTLAQQDYTKSVADWEEERRARAHALGQREVDLAFERGRVETDAKEKLAALRVEDLQPQIDAWQVAQAQATHELEISALQLEAELSGAQAEALREAQALDTRKKALDAKLAAHVRPGEHPGLADARKTVASLEAYIQLGIKDSQGLQNKRRNVLSLGVGSCPACGQPITEGHLQTEAARMDQELQEKAGQIQQAQTRLGEWAAHVQALEAMQAQALAAYDATRALLASEQAELAGYSANLSGSAAARDRRREDLERARQAALAKRHEVNPWATRAADQARSLEHERKLIQTRLESELARVGALQAETASQAAAVAGEVNPWKAKAAEHEAHLTRQRESVQALEQVRAVQNDAMRYLDFWVEAFGRQGLRSYVLDRHLQELTDAANQWVQLLTGGVVWVKFESQKELRSKKGELVNAPDLQIFRWNPDGTVTKRSYRSWSGGEKQRISFAVDFGLSRLIARRARQTYDLLILDEAFKHLDRSGKEATVEMLQQLTQEKSAVIVVEHDSDFKDAFDQSILIEKKGRRSRIVPPEEVTGGKQPEAHAMGEVGQAVPADPPVRRKGRRRAGG
jgi:DNA repair exonuclease SbcCD ATPase subunit